MVKALKYRIMTGSRRSDEAAAAAFDKADCNKTKGDESKIHSASVASRDFKKYAVFSRGKVV